MTILHALLTAVAGLLDTVQASAPASLIEVPDHPNLAALIDWLRGSRLARIFRPSWIGGAAGGAYVLAMILLAERLGAAALTGKR